MSKEPKKIKDPRKLQRRLQRQTGVMSAKFRTSLERWFGVIDKEYRYVLKVMGIKKGTVAKAGLDDRIIRIFDWKSIERQGKELLTPAELKMYKQAVKAALLFTGLTMMVDTEGLVSLNANFLKIAEARAGLLVTNITAGMRQNIHAAVVEAIRTGQSADVLARTIRPGLPVLPVSIRRINRQVAERIAAGATRSSAMRWAGREMTKMRNYRAFMIARTEAIAAMEDGALLGYDEAGVRLVEFLASVDACEECLDYDGRRWPPDEAVGLIPIHPNGRCSFVPVIESIL